MRMVTELVGKFFGVPSIRQKHPSGSLVNFFGILFHFVCIFSPIPTHHEAKTCLGILFSFWYVLINFVADFLPLTQNQLSHSGQAA